MRKELREKFQAWRDLSIEIKDLVAKEMIIRKQLVKQVSEELGTHRLKDDIIEVTVKNGLYYYVDKEGLLAIWKMLSREEKDCIRWKPELSLREYKKLDEYSSLSRVITTKPSAPSMEVKIYEDSKN